VDSFIFARRERRIIMLEAAIKELTVFVKNYSLDDSYIKKLLPNALQSSNEFPLIDWFVVFSFNLSKVQKG
jgi:hypothetical protein